MSWNWREKTQVFSLGIKDYNNIILLVNFSFNQGYKDNEKCTIK